MRFTSQGIGWLIAGGIICASSVSSDGLASAVGMLMIGLVFVAVYVIRQFFKPRGIGWFIAGGLLLAFSVETVLDVTGGILKNSFLDRDDLSSTLIALVIACACMFAFYKSNKHAVDHMASEMGIDLPQSGYTEPADAPAEAASGPAAADVQQEGSEVEFEIRTASEDESDNTRSGQ